MSWCRWSTDNFRCDLYIYDDCAGYVSVMVAGRKTAWTIIPDPVHTMFCWTWKWYESRFGRVVYVVWRALWAADRAIAPWRKVPWKAGECLAFTDMNELATWLLEARRNGLRFPDSVWPQLVEAAKDADYNDKRYDT
jgi:hypothetical protein